MAYLHNDILYSHRKILNNLSEIEEYHLSKISQDKEKYYISLINGIERDKSRVYTI